MMNKKEENRAKKEEERKKRLIMWVGISLIMFLILVGWTFSIKSVFNQSKNTSTDFDKSEWNEIKDELSQAINKAREDIDQFKNDSIIQELKNELENVDYNNQEDIILQPLPSAEDKVNIFSEENILDLPVDKQD